MITPTLAEWELLKTASSKFALKCWELGGHQECVEVAVGLPVDRSSCALKKSCRNLATCGPTKFGSGDGSPILSVFHRCQRLHAIQINNLALLSSDTYKNLDKRSVKSIGGEEIAWLNQPCSLHTCSTSRQPSCMLGTGFINNVEPDKSIHCGQSSVAYSPSKYLHLIWNL